MKKPSKAYISIGSNIGDRHANINRALEMLRAEEDIAVTAVSSLIETAPVGFENQPNFINAAAELRTNLNPRELLKALMNIESKMGRTREIRWGPRVIDLDLLLYNDEHIDESELQIPHPRMMERAFVLTPLAEIAPNLILPDGRTAREAAASLKDESSADEVSDI